MNRFCLIVFLTAAGWSYPAFSLADEPRELKILARGPWPHLPTHAGAGPLAQRTLAIRSERELAQAAGAGGLLTVPKALKVDAIDFDKQILLVVEDGTQPMVGVSGGGPPSAPLAVVIERVERNPQNKTTIVHWRRISRAAEHGILTRPLAAALVDRFDGEVAFNKLADGGKEALKPAGAEIKVAARAFWRDGWPAEAPRQEWVIRNYADLIDSRLRAPEHILERMRKEAAEKYAKALRVDTIDFTKQMLIGVSAGVQPATARADVVRIVADGKTMTLQWRLHAPERGAKPAGIIHPAEVVLVERSDAEVKFQQMNQK